MSFVRCFTNVRLRGRFRRGCHGLHVDTRRWENTGRTGCVRFATHLRTCRMSSISCLVAQFTVMLKKSMPVFFSRPFLSQTSSLTLNQIHVVGSSQSVFHIENQLYPPDISFVCVVHCLLAPCWSTLKHKSISIVTWLLEG